MVLTDKDSKRIKFGFRVTDVYRKIGGKWLIIHEHVSVPVDPATAKANLLSQP
jgi:ketosteroid isomerase-like protein